MHGRILQQNVSSIRDTVNGQQNNGLEQLSSAQILSYASVIWRDKQSMAKLMAAEASHIIQIVSKRRPTFFSGKSEKGLLCGMFCLLSLKNKALKTQGEIARSLDTTDVTIRASYRKWLEEFPDLFLDLCPFLAEDEKIGLFVPSKHRKRRELY
jgi:hypothetical protein